MKIDFVRPSMTGRPAGDAMEPSAFAVLAALSPSDVDWALRDERLEPLEPDLGADLAALTVDTFSARRAYQVAAHYRSRGVPVVLGGFHPSLCPEEALRHADAVVRGDAESVWPRVVEDARRRRLEAVYEGGRPDAPHPRPDRGVFRGKRYRLLRLVQFARGCRHRCDFCSIHAAYGSRTRLRPAVAVAEEIGNAGSGHILFTDDNLFADERSARELFHALRPLGVRWSCQVSLDVAARPDLLGEMSRSGCTAVIAGFESPEEGSLVQMGKGWNRAQGRYEDLVEAFRDHGIMVYGTFVFGYDADTGESVRRALDFAVRSRLFLANFNPLVPTPGTPLYERLRREGRLLRETWWLDPGYRYGDVVFRPVRMSAPELAEACFEAKREFNSARGIAVRALDRRANARTPARLALYLAANLVNRGEILRKQGAALACPESAGEEVIP